MTQLRLTRALLPFTAVVAAGLALLWPAEASAGPRVALDLDYAGTIDEDDIGSGTGGALRFGYEVDLIAVSLTAEVGASYHTFTGDLDPSHYEGFVGARLAFGKIIEPSIFAHAGIGRLNLDAVDVHDTGPEFDVGLALDLTVLPLLDVGVHAAYDFQKLDSGDNFDWYRVGAHVALVF
jgi:hypothetical protein